MPKANFPEKLTPFLIDKLSILESTYGKDSWEYKGLAHQYLRNELEDVESDENNIKHYEASLQIEEFDHLAPGMERLYGKVIVVEPTLVCAAHCRYCLRGNYTKHTLSEKQLNEVAKYCGNENNRDIVNEVLITGGDPLIIPKRLEVLLEAFIEYAPNIRIVRIGSRLPGHDPSRIDENVLSLFINKPSLRFELATQINHPVEFFPEVIDAFKRISALGVKIYSQNVLLKGVNDNVDTLVELYNQMRVNNIEAHYLFHAVPLIGTHHLRTSVAKGLEIMKGLVCSGKISGRAKPMYAAMTDIGKIIFYDGVILDEKGNKLLLQSKYLMNNRMMWNPSWQLPQSAEVDNNGFLRVWYLDGGK